MKKLKWGDKSIGVGIKSETGLSLGMSSAQGAQSGNLPYYQSISSAGGGFSGQNGGYGGYLPSDGGHGGYRAGGGRAGPGGRRGPGASSSVGSAQGAVDGTDATKRAAGGKKGKPKGAREPGTRDGAADAPVRAGAAPAKEALNLADFPVLESAQEKQQLVGPRRHRDGQPDGRK